MLNVENVQHFWSNGYWLRWWDHKGELLLWSWELAQREPQLADRLLQQLRAAGLEPEG